MAKLYGQLDNYNKSLMAWANLMHAINTILKARYRCWIILRIYDQYVNNCCWERVRALYLTDLVCQLCSSQWYSQVVWHSLLCIVPWQDQATNHQASEATQPLLRPISHEDWGGFQPEQHVIVLVLQKRFECTLFQWCQVNQEEIRPENPSIRIFSLSYCLACFWGQRSCQCNTFLLLLFYLPNQPQYNKHESRQ